MPHVGVSPCIFFDRAVNHKSDSEDEEMALPNSLALVFATASLANGLSECCQYFAYLRSNTQSKPSKASPIASFQQYLPNLVEVNTGYHLFNHVSLWTSCVWSLFVLESTRRHMAAVLAFEFAAMAIARWIMEAVKRIEDAKDVKEIEAGLRLLMRRQLIRYVTTHAPSVVLCIYALASG